MPCARFLLVVLTAAAVVAGCGKRGAPLSPIRIVPGPVTNLYARRVGDDIRISFNVPAVNADNSTPPKLAAVEIYAVAGPPIVAAATPVSFPGLTLSVPANYVPPPVVTSARPPAPGSAAALALAAAAAGPPPLAMSRFSPVALFDPTATASTKPVRPSKPLPSTLLDIVTSKYRQTRIEVRPVPKPAPGEPPPPADAPPPSPDPTPTDPRPGPGGLATFTTQVAAQRAAAPKERGASVYRVVVVGVTDGGRRGSPSAVLEFPLTTEIAPSKDPVLTYSAASVQLAWTPGAPAQAFRVYRSDPAGKEEARPLTTAPLALPAFTTPVEFGIERCFVIRAVVVRSPASTESAPTAPICVNAVDTFPPAPPTALSVLPSETQVQLVWTGVTTADLAGYIVLRGVDGAAPEPLNTAPLTSTSYSDTNIRAGARYSYVVVSVDKAGNRSAPSNRVDEAR